MVADMTVKCKQNALCLQSSGKRKGEGGINNDNGMRETDKQKKFLDLLIFPSLVEVTSYRYGISWSQRFCCRAARLYFDRQTEKIHAIPSCGAPRPRIINQPLME